MQTLTDIRIYTGIMRREGDDLLLTGVKVVSDEWIHVYADDDSINIVRVPVGAVCECESQPIPEPTPRCDNSGTNILATLLRGADGKGVSGGYFGDDGTLILVMEDGSKVSVGKINLSNYYTKKEVDGKRLPNPLGLSYSFNGTSSIYDGSMSKYLPSIYAPSSAGKKGQILSSNGAGEPVWANVSSLSGVKVSWEDVQNKPTTIKSFGITDTYTKQEIEDKGYLTDDDMPSSLPNPQALEIIVDGVTQSYNGNEVVRIGITTPKETDVAKWGFTKNLGTITGIKMNGVSKGTRGEVDLGTVITEHQDISGKQDIISDLENIRNGAVKGATSVQPSQLARVAATGSYNDLKDTPTIPSKLSDLEDDGTHRTVTDTEKTTWSNKSNFSGNYTDLNGKPTFKTINGESILGDGDIPISGGSSTPGSAQLPTNIITSSAAMSYIIPSGKVTVFAYHLSEGNDFFLDSTNIEEGVDNVWIIRFAISEDNTGEYQVTSHENEPIKWANGVAPTFENGKYYELSFRYIKYRAFLGVWASFE